ncbi:helicase HerA domain-containing protein [Streptomyces uncialis]|uniref:ATP-binding protein n=1 Tax=Streptomyces uncialis TaxID=1048205 RepID=UPI003653F6C0
MPESAPLIGLGSGRKKVSVDRDADSPHVLISAGTGGGKSTILRTICCQFIHNGAKAFVLDFKRISHTWARGVPGVTYCRDIADIHDALIQLAREGRHRLALAEQFEDDVLEREPWRVGPRPVILLEAAGNPSPAPRGRPAARPRARRTPPPPRSPVPLPTPRAPPPAAPALPAPANVPGPVAVDTGSRAPTAKPAPPAPPGAEPGDAAVGLRTAQQNHLPDITLAALRWARANDPDFPPTVGNRGAEFLYRVGDLKKWARNRPRGTSPTSAD